MAGKDLREIVSQIKEIPTLPQVAVTLMELLNDTASGAQEINRVMSRDPALAAKILRLVNSSYYGLSNQVSSLNQAIVILGFKTVRSVALSASVMGLFKERGSERFDRTHFWKHSIACACVARLVAKKQVGLDPEASFSAGLLHDIGKLVLGQADPAALDRILADAQERGTSFVEAERVMLGTDHGEIGRWLLETWCLPREIVAGAAYHHNIEAAPDRRAIAVIQFADYISKVKGLAATGSCEIPELDMGVWALLSIERSDLPEMVRAINEEIEGASSWLEAAV